MCNRPQSGSGRCVGQRAGVLHCLLSPYQYRIWFVACRNDFERANTDVFMFEDKNVGSLKKIRIGHDGSGLGAGWHLQRVVVENLTTGQVYTFEVNRCVLTLVCVQHVRQLVSQQWYRTQ